MALSSQQFDRNAVTGKTREPSRLRYSVTAHTSAGRRLTRSTAMKMSHRIARKAQVYCAIQIIALLFTPLVCAQTTYTWTGAASGNWGAAGNWSPNGVPGATRNGTDIAEFGPSTRRTVTVTGGGTNGFDFGMLKFLANAPAYTFS